MTNNRISDDVFLRALGYQEGLEHVTVTMLKDRLPLCTISRYTGISMEGLIKLEAVYQKELTRQVVKESQPDINH